MQNTPERKSTEDGIAATRAQPPLFLRRPDLAELPELSALPGGYRPRQMEPADVPAVAALLGAAFPERTWTPYTTRLELVDDSTVKTTFLVEHAGRPVATASVRLMPDRYPDSGYLHWVGADLDHRGRGLGRYVTLAALHEFARLGCRDAVLETEDFRRPALRTYLSLGFVPEYRHPSHEPRWAAIHVALAGR